MSKIKTDNEKVRPVQMTLPYDIVRKIDKAASEAHLSRSSWIRIAALNEIRRQKQTLLQGSQATNQSNQATTDIINGGDPNDDSKR